MISGMKTRSLIAVLAFVLGIGTVPHRVCERDAGAVWEGEAAHVDALAARVDEHVRGELREATFATGSRRYDGEWLFGTYMMSALGFGQVAAARADAREQDLDRMEACLDAMLAATSFDREAWLEDPVEARRGHIAWLGYAGMALALHRAMRPDSRFAAREVDVIAAIERRYAHAALAETYPGEIYPVDNAAALAALALHARATRGLPSAALANGLAAMRRAIDPATGLLAQSLAEGGRRGPARGSGTALAAYFLSYADVPTSAALWRALATSQLRTVLGFGAVLEQTDGSSRGDIDSGPVVFGFGVSATGFALGASRAHGDRDAFRALYATAHLFGAPSGGAFTTGGPLGDAILFAMTTAPEVRS